MGELPEILVDRRGQPLISSDATPQQTLDYGGGFCHVLALVLSEQTGWPIRALGRPADQYSLRPLWGLSGLPRHLYCLDPHARPVDIHGVFADEAAIRRFYSDLHEPDEPLCSVTLTPEQVHQLPALGYLGFGQREIELTAKALRQLNLARLSQQTPARVPSAVTGSAKTAGLE